MNGSAGSVQVSSIAMNNGGWTLTDYNSGDRSKLAEAKVDSKKLGLSLAVTGNVAVTSKDGSQTPTIDTSKWTMSGGSELPITVGAIATASSAKTSSEVTAANVVFTLAWKQQITISFTITELSQNIVSCSAERGMTWRQWCESSYHYGTVYVNNKTSTVYVDAIISPLYKNGVVVNADDVIEDGGSYSV